jgi:hypothetical protein
LNRDDLDLKVSTLLWAYRTTCKKITGHTPFIMVYGKEELVPLDYSVPSLCIAMITNMTEEGVAQEKLDQLMELAEETILVGIFQEVHKLKDNAWHDRNIKKIIFKEGYLVILYDSRYLQHPGKFKMHWLGPYQVESITNGGVVQLKYLVEMNIKGLVNGSRMKLYQDSRPNNLR